MAEVMHKEVFHFLHAVEDELLDWDDREQLEILAVRL
jgi:hypothetical protein